MATDADSTVVVNVWGDSLGINSMLRAGKPAAITKVGMNPSWSLKSSPNAGLKAAAALTEALNTPKASPVRTDGTLSATRTVTNTSRLSSKWNNAKIKMR